MTQEKAYNPKQGDTLSLNVQETVSADFLGVLDIELHQCLRYLPGRRSVWRSLSDGREVLLKIYNPHPKQERDAGSEWRNAVQLQEAHLEIPAPLFLATSEDGLLVVGFDFIENGMTLDKALKTEDAGNANIHREALGQLVDLHRRQHLAGCYQQDDHLGNYLWSQGKLWMLDAGSCVFTAAPLDKRGREANMALLAANVPLSLNSVFHEVMTQCYDVEFSNFQVSEKSAIQTRLRNYYKKTRRSCSEFEQIQSSQKTWLACRDMDNGLKQKLLSNPDQFFDGEPLVKNGNTCSVVEVHEGGKSYILKRYNQKSFMYRLSHLLITPRALLSWSNGHVLSLFDVPTPRPVACLLLKTGMLVRRGYLLMEKVEGAPLHKIDQSSISEDSQELPRQFARIWHQLDQLDATHGDMKASNFMVNDQGELILIDLDSLTFHRSSAEKERGQAKDMKRFMRNWERDATVQSSYQKGLDDAG